MKKIRIIGTLLLLAVVLLSNTRSAEDEPATTIFADGVSATYRMFNKKGKPKGDLIYYYSQYENEGGVRKVRCKVKNATTFLVSSEFYLVNDGDNLYNSPQMIFQTTVALPAFDPDLKEYHIMPITENMVGKKQDDLHWEIIYSSNTPGENKIRILDYKNRTYVGKETIKTALGDLECHLMTCDFINKVTVKKTQFMKLYYHEELGIISMAYYDKTGTKLESKLEIISTKVKTK